MDGQKTNISQRMEFDGDFDIIVSSTLTRASLSSEDDGMYKCVATNIFNSESFTHQQNITIIVQCK